MDKLQSMLSKLPIMYNINEDSVLYKLISAFASEYDNIASQIDRADNMIGIDTVNGDDLEYRFGSMMSLPRQVSETDDQYRDRLKNSIVSLSGGTAYAIKYAVAVGLGINNNPIEMDNSIRIYDAWEYTGSASVPDGYKTPGHIICEIDIAGDFVDVETKVSKSANMSKAAGTNIMFFILNYYITKYIDFNQMAYNNLGTSLYSKLGTEA